MSVTFLIKPLEGIREVLLVYPDNTIVKKNEDQPSLQMQLLIKFSLSDSTWNFPMAYTLLFDNKGSKGDTLKIEFDSRAGARC